MNDKMKMDIRLEIIEGLYEGDDEFAERIRAERPDLSNELESMQSMKAALDARPSRRPDAATFDAVLRAAAGATAGRPSETVHPTGRQDRPPRARRALYLRSAGVATTVLTVLIAVTTLWQADLLDVSLPIETEQIAAEQPERESASMADRPERAVAAENQSEHTDQDRSELATMGQDRSEDAATGQDSYEVAASDQNRSEAAAMNQDRSKAAAQNQSGRARTGQNLANSYQILPGGGVPALETLVSDESSGFGNRAFVRAMADGQHVSADREMQTGKRYVSGRTDGALFSAASSEMRRRPSDILPVGMRPTEAAAYIGDARQSDASDPMSNENLVWDQAAAVMEMYQQIEMIGEGVARGWEPPSVPLEMMPASREGGASGLQPAGERRTP